MERERLHSVISGVLVILFAVDAERRLTMAEGKALELLGARPNEHLGEDLCRLLPDRPEICEGVHTALAGYPAMATSVTGSGIRLEVHLTPVRETSGQVTGAHGVALDVTQQFAAEAARAEARAKTEAMHVLSHEIRNPLNTIIGYAQMLTMPGSAALDEKQRRWVSNIHAAGEDLLALANDTLDLSKLAAGKLELEYERLALEPVLGLALDRVRPAAASREVRLNLVCAAGMDLYIDRRRLLQVITNLLSNAVKNTPEGGGVELRATRQRGDIAIAVRDTGTGIPPDQMERIFEEFVMLDSGKSGTGLGLPICRKLVGAMGGRLAVQSELGAGSTFTIELPQSPPASEVGPRGQPGGRLGDLTPAGSGRSG
jgi:signal transduction histidine kinase